MSPHWSLKSKIIKISDTFDRRKDSYDLLEDQHFIIVNLRLALLIIKFCLDVIQDFTPILEEEKMIICLSDILGAPYKDHDNFSFYLFYMYVYNSLTMG